MKKLRGKIFRGVECIDLLVEDELLASAYIHGSKEFYIYDGDSYDHSWVNLYVFNGVKKLPNSFYNGVHFYCIGD